MNSHYQIEYYNKMWKDWLAFDQLFYKSEKDAKSRINAYMESVPDIQTRIVQTTILIDKPKRSKKQTAKVTTEKV